jgi:hypothetical protein
VYELTFEDFSLLAVSSPDSFSFSLGLELCIQLDVEQWYLLISA